MSDGTGQNEIFDLIGVGLGPANLSLAVVLQEEAERAGGADLKRLFLECKPAHAWHPGLLIGGSQLQINVLKDLITIHNPCSRFSFLSYLKDEGRLYEFLNIGDLYPSRYEFNDYLGWAARRLSDVLRYGKRVLGVDPVEQAADGTVEVVRVRVEDVLTGEQEEYLTRNLVVATGGTPTTPPGIELTAGGKAFHPHEFLQRIETDFADTETPYRFVVVGAGQTAAELFYYLMLNYPNADVTATIRRWAYKQADDTDFTNEVFFPDKVDLYYDLPPEKRKHFFEIIKDVNYAVIDKPLIQKIYRTLYRHKVEGRERARVLPFMQLQHFDEKDDGITATFLDLLRDEEKVLETDVLIIATGYEWRKEHPLLEGLSGYFQRDEEGGYRVQRDYSVAPQGGLGAGVYLQGYCESTHGISETVLSLLPVRANDILQSIRARERDAREEAAAPALESSVPS